jgi:hypothetical protein
VDWIHPNNVIVWRQAELSFSLLGLLFDPEDGVMFLIFHECWALSEVCSVTTAVRTSNPKRIYPIHNTGQFWAFVNTSVNIPVP